MVDIMKEGPKALDAPPTKHCGDFEITQDDYAYIDETSGLTDFIEHYLGENQVPETIRAKLRSRVTPYTGTKSKETIAYEFHEKLMGR